MPILSSKLQHWLEFLLVMTEKEIKARYKHAVLGFLWVILNPLLQMAVIGFVFQFFIPVEVDNYFLFLFTGLLPWNFFSMTISKTTPMFVYERSLIQKAKFPREAIVLSIVMSNLFHLVISLLLLLVVMMAMGINIGLVNLLLLPFALVWLVLLTAGLSLLFSSLNVKFRDVNFFVQAIIPLWFYATPIVYTLDLLPETLQWFFYLNPMTTIIEVFRLLILNISISSEKLITLSVVTSLLLVGIGAIVFKRKSPNFDDWL